MLFCRVYERQLRLSNASFQTDITDLSVVSDKRDISLGGFKIQEYKDNQDKGGMCAVTIR